MKSGAKDIKSHRWFGEVDWNDVYNRKYDVRCQMDALSVLS